MAIFGRLSGAIWQLVAPRKSAAERVKQRRKQAEKTNIPAPALDDLRRRRSMSPSARVRLWHLASPGSPIPRLRTTELWDAPPSVELTSPGEFAARKARGMLAEPIKTSGRSIPLVKQKATDKTNSGIKKRRRAAPSLQPWKARTGTDTRVTRIVRSVENDNQADLARSPRMDKPVELDLALDGRERDVSEALSEIVVHVSPSRSPPQEDPSRDPQPCTPKSQQVNTPAATPLKDLMEHSPVPTTASQVPRVALENFPLSVQPLITRILLRGREPILPSHWRFDFRYFPPSLFCLPGQQAHLSSLSNANFRATRALQSLLNLAPRVRDAVLVGSRPEPAAAKVVGEFIAWAMRDAGIVRALPPMLAFYTGHKDETNEDLQSGLARKMETAVSLWQDYVQEGEKMPVVYGVVLCETVLGITYYQPDGGDGEGVEEGMRIVGMFDLSATGLDVWNALAVALLAIHIRDAVRAWIVENE